MSSRGTNNGGRNNSGTHFWLALLGVLLGTGGVAGLITAIRGTSPTPTPTPSLSRDTGGKVETKPTPISTPEVTETKSPQRMPEITQSPFTSSEEKGFLFELRGCRKTNETDVNCEFFIKNKQEERYLSLDNARAISSQGVEYYSGNVIVAGLSSAYASYPPGVGRAVSLIFSEVPKQDSLFNLMEISASVGSSESSSSLKNFKIRFSNISIEG